MKHVLFFATALTGAVALGCIRSPEPNQPVAMAASSRVPAAQGQVKLDDAGNGNTAVAVQVKHLAPADHTTPGATTYVVWAQPPNGAPQNLGALQLGPELDGSLKTITPLRDFELFVTPEPSATSPAPTGERVLSTRVNRK